MSATSVAIDDLSIALMVSVKRKRSGRFKASARWRELDVNRSSDGARARFQPLIRSMTM